MGGLAGRGGKGRDEAGKTSAPASSPPFTVAALARVWLQRGSFAHQGALLGLMTVSSFPSPSVPGPV